MTHLPGTTTLRDAQETAPVSPIWITWIAPGLLALAVALILLASPLGSPGDSITVWDSGRVGDQAVAWSFVEGTGWAESILSWLLATAGGISVVVGALLGRRRPGLATTLALWPFVAIPVLGTFVWGWWFALLAITCLALQGSWRRCIYPLAATLATAWAYTLANIPAATPVGQVHAGAGEQPWDWAAFWVYTVATGIVVLGAVAVRLVGDTRQRGIDAAAATLKARELETVTTERARLARDLHDVVAHHVSLIAVRAEAAPFQHPDLPPEARTVLQDIATDARSALGELRHVLAVLRRSDEADRRPQPGACDIDDLVTQARAAGQDVVVDGTCEGISAAQGYVLFRAVQEALTNARRHAPGATTTVTFSAHPELVGVRVENPVLPDATPGASAPGRGLLGMRERVEALGGAVQSDVEDGTYLLVVTLPIAVARAAARPRPPDPTRAPSAS